MGRPQASCTLAFAPGDALAGVDGPVRVLERWDPDGAGPAPVHVVVAGRFEVAGTVVSPNIAAYEPVAREWVALGPGLPADVVAVAARPNGNLLATCTTAAAVFEWNGAGWQQLGGTFGGPLAGPPRSLSVMPNGDVVAGGPFTAVAGAPIHDVARWDGTAWQPMGARRCRGRSAPSTGSSRCRTAT